MGRHNSTKHAHGTVFTLNYHVYQNVLFYFDICRFFLGTEHILRIIERCLLSKIWTSESQLYLNHSTKLVRNEIVLGENLIKDTNQGVT